MNLLLAAVLAPAAFLAPQEKPFPTTTIELKEDGAVYYVEGEQRIEGRHTVNSLRHMRLVGKGENPVLIVDGTLSLKAVTGGAVEIENLTIEVSPECRDIYLSDVTFKGTGGLKTRKEAPADTDLYLTKIRFEGRSALDLEMTGGKLNLQSSYSKAPARIIGVDPTPKKACKLQLLMLGNSRKGRGQGSANGFFGGFTLENVAKATVQTTDFAGGDLRIADCTQLEFGANLVRCRKAEIRHSEFSGLKKTKVVNCDFKTKDVVFFVPRDENKPDKLQRFTISKSYFGGPTEEDAIRAERVIDSGRDPENGLIVRVKKALERPLGAAGG